MAFIRTMSLSRTWLKSDSDKPSSMLVSQPRQSTDADLNKVNGSKPTLRRAIGASRGEIHGHDS
jgi:hypothetical protein